MSNAQCFGMKTLTTAPMDPPSPLSTRRSSTHKKRHQCTVCQKLFSRPSALLTHEYTHTGEKPFQCQIPGCGRYFTVQSNLRRHSKVHSPNPSPRRRLSAQVRHRFILEMMANREHH